MRVLGVLVLSLGCFAVTFSVVHNDVNQTGANSSETILTPAKVSGGSFRKLGTLTVDGAMWAQPLYVSGLTIGGISRNVLFVATMNNTLYAFDADLPGSAVLWSRNLGLPRTSYPNVTNCGGACDPTEYGLPIGIMSTPVIDLPNNRIYTVNTNTTPTWVLSQINLTTGALIAQTTITGQVPGTGDPTGGDTVSGGNVVFYPAFERNRSGLALANGKVYIAFASYDDIHPWHGWLFAYNVSDLSQAGIFCVSPNTYGGAIWMGGGAPAVDGSGNVYVVTGNDNYDGTTAFGESVLKFSPTLTLLDWFTPSDFADLDSHDLDMASNRVILIPGTSKWVASGKDFNVYVGDQSCMGHLQGSSGCSLQTFQDCVGCSTTDPHDWSGAYGSLFLNNVLYLPTVTGSLYAFSWTGSAFTTTPLASVVNTLGLYPGPSAISGSINGSTNGIVWVTTCASSAGVSVMPGVLRALNPTTLAEYWNSGTSLGSLSKFTAPTIAGGKVFVATQDSTVAVFGLAPSSQSGGAITFGGATSGQ